MSTIISDKLTMDDMPYSSKNQKIGECSSSAQEINVDALMWRIRQSYRNKWNGGMLQAESPEDLGDLAGKDISEISFRIRCLNRPAIQLEIDLDVTSSKLDRLPLVGLLWRKTRVALHRISLHYVRKVTAFLLPFQRHVTDTLALLFHHQQQHSKELEVLRDRLVELEKRVANMESKL
ncbi:MAG: hypothetical protein ACUVT8_12745 [Armatimonadota bacterium]